MNFITCHEFCRSKFNQTLLNDSLLHVDQLWSLSGIQLEDDILRNQETSLTYLAIFQSLGAMLSCD